MTYELVKKKSREHHRDGLAIRGSRDSGGEGCGIGGPAARRINRRFTNHVCDNKLWILCVCRGQGAARPVIVPRRVGPDSVNLVNLPNADVPHAEYCVFRLRDAEGSRTNAVPDDFLDPFPFVGGHRNLPGPGEGKERRRDRAGPSMGRVPAKASNILKRLIQGAQLNTLAGVERFASPGEWLAEIRRAAEALYMASIRELYASPCYGGGETGPVIGAGG